MCGAAIALLQGEVNLGAHTSSDRWRKTRGSKDYKTKLV